jgi:hypothetical protein
MAIDALLPKTDPDREFTAAGIRLLGILPVLSQSELASRIDVTSCLQTRPIGYMRLPASVKLSVLLCMRLKLNNILYS